MLAQQYKDENLSLDHISETNTAGNHFSSDLVSISYNTIKVCTTCEDFYNFVEFLCPTSITSGIIVAETLLMIFPLE